jgi:hypothetical protein
MLCLTSSPTWDAYNDGAQYGNMLYGVEYSTGGGSPVLQSLNGYNVPCAVCERSSSTMVFMLPGSQSCPAGWTAMYAGYLMSTHYTQTKNEHICVDRNAVGMGSSNFETGTYLYPTESMCGGSLPCGPYVNYREVTCAVCAK